MSDSGWTTPVSLLAVMTATLRDPRRQRPRQRVGVDDAVRVHGQLAGVHAGLPPRRGPTRARAGCSTAEYSTTASPRSRRAASAGPSTARLADSVPPEVKTISPGSRPRKAATSSRASSSRRRARCAGGMAAGRVPEQAGAAWTSAMAAATSGRSGVVAAWSR